MLGDISSHYKHLEQIKNVPIETVVAAAKKAVQDMEAFGAETKNWTMPVQSPCKLQAFQVLQHSLKKTGADIDRYLDSMSELKADLCQSRIALTKSWQDDRNRILHFFKSCTAPVGAAPILKQIADYLQNWSIASSPEKRTELQYPATSLDEAGEWLAEPTVFLCTAVEPPVTYLHGAIAAYMKDNQDKIQHAHDRNVQVMSSDGTNHRHKSIDEVNPLAVNAKEGHKLFSKSVEDTPIKGVLFSFRCAKIDIRQLAWPFRGQRMVITCTHGLVGVLLVTPTQAIAEDVQSWIPNCHHTELSKNKVRMLFPGDGIYVPLGWVPILMSIPFLAEKEIEPLIPNKGQAIKGLLNNDQFSAVACHLIMDAPRDIKASTDLLQVVLTGWVGGLARCPDSIRSMASVKDWQAQVEAAVSSQTTE